MPQTRTQPTHAPIEGVRPMEAKSAVALPKGKDWWYEPKWDGFRCIAAREGDHVTLTAKSGKPLTRYFPEVADHLASLPFGRFVVDGELLVAAAGRYEFDALQMRLHPAESRIHRLARETPAVLTLFDMLVSSDGADLRQAPFRDRRAALQAFVGSIDDARLPLTPGTEDLTRAEAWLQDKKVEGVIAKDLTAPYREGERAMTKVKRLRTADCVVGGFRYGEGSPLVGSLLLGLYDDHGRLNHVGFTSGLSAADKPALTGELEALRGGSGFTGDAPGGPSRWSTERSVSWVPLQPEMVVEVSFDHVTAGRFRHGTRLIRFRPDKAPDQCRCEQLDQ